MSSATSDSTESAHAMQQDKTKSSADSFALLVKPFDAVEGKPILTLNPSSSIMIWVPPRLVWDATYGITPPMLSLFAASTHPTPTLFNTP